MRRATTFILAAGFTLLLATGAMAWGGYGRGGGYGGCMMVPVYHMHQGNGYGPGYQGRGYAPVNCPGSNAYQNGGQSRGHHGSNQGYGPGYHGQAPGRGYRQMPR